MNIDMLVLFLDNNDRNKHDKEEFLAELQHLGQIHCYLIHLKAEIVIFQFMIKWIYLNTKMQSYIQIERIYKLKEYYIFGQIDKLQNINFCGNKEEYKTQRYENKDTHKDDTRL